MSFFKVPVNNNSISVFQMIAKLPAPNEQVTKEIEQYEKQLIDIDTLSEKATEALKEKDDLRSKLDLLEKRVKVNTMSDTHFYNNKKANIKNSLEGFS